MHIIKNIFFIIVTILLLITLEVMTVKALDKFDSTNGLLQKESANYKHYDKDITLSQMVYSEQSTKELMNMLINNKTSTLKNITHKKFILDIYQRNHYIPMWFTNKGVRTKKINDLFTTIQNDATLDNKGNIRKHFKYLKEKISTSKTRNMKNELKLDIKLSALYRDYMGYHINGAINWWSFQKKLKSLRRHKVAANWVTNNPKYNIADLMFSYTIPHIISATTPSSFGYNEMYKELKRLRKVQANGGWKKIPNSSQLRYGKSGKVVRQLTKRLQSEGDYTCKHASSTYTFDRCLKKALKRFQKRHGLYGSGKLNKVTRSRLNLSVNWKIKKVLLNLDRIKRLPDQAENRYIMVNIPDFNLYYKENGREKLRMRVVVGDKKHHTPIFSNKVSFIVLNPYWLIPDSIVKKEMIPKILKNPNYLEQRGYEVRKNYKLTRPPINTSKIDWAKVLRTGQTKKYKFMQPPGPKNALGKIKFKFPNRFAVYLHDTPAKKYFKKGVRAFSHGCIRISKPNALLATFAPHERSVNYNRSQRILKGKTKTQLNLSKPVPVHILYLTAWINSDGLLHYRNDIYGYDSKQHRTIY